MSDNHSDLTFVEGLGKAVACSIPIHHAPRPARFIWHHILPQACGGLTEAVNLVQLCDNCHYTIHGMLYQLRIKGIALAGTKARKYQLYWAQNGYAAAKVAGTTAAIPDEGGTD